MSNYIGLMPPAYYDSLIEWDLMDEIFELVEQEYHSHAYQLLSQIMDYIVLETVLLHLHSEHHLEFISLCSHQHHEPSLLNWLEERNQNIIQILREQLANSKQDIKTQLLDL